jgi:response regulator RpfG family c-di-GMP phosphodiesterase
MSASATVLLASADEATVEEFRATLALERGVRSLVTLRAAETLALVRESRPDLVVVDQGLVGSGAFDLCRNLRAQPGMADAMIVLVVAPGSDELKQSGLGVGVDEYLTRPLEPADLLAKVRWMQRIKRVNEELRSDRLELERLHVELRRGFDHLLELLVSLVDMRLPGAAARGERTAELALGLAERFEVPPPMRRDLDIAARLHEMGRVLAGREEPDPEPHPPGAHGMRFVLATRALLQRVDGLAEAAELVGAIFENWDGSGFPNHLRQGQIPMRSRILRVVIDFMTALAAPGNPSVDEVLDRLDDHRGTCYDPVVIVQLQEMLASGPQSELRDSRVRLAIPDLHVDMVLAEDLCTDTGLKLLARGTRLSAPALEIIQRRHRLEPLLEGATVLRQSA